MLTLVSVRASSWFRVRLGKLNNVLRLVRTKDNLVNFILCRERQNVYLKYSENNNSDQQYINPNANKNFIHKTALNQFLMRHRH
jgi:hypothetical protein